MEVESQASHISTEHFSSALRLHHICPWHRCYGKDLSVIVPDHPLRPSFGLTATTLATVLKRQPTEKHLFPMRAKNLRFGTWDKQFLSKARAHQKGLPAWEREVNSDTAANYESLLNLDDCENQAHSLFLSTALEMSYSLSPNVFYLSCPFHHWAQESFCL